MNRIRPYFAYDFIGSVPHGLEWARRFDWQIHERYPSVDVYLREMVPHEFDDQPVAVQRTLAVQPMAGFMRLTRVTIPPPGERSPDELFLAIRREPVMVAVVDGFNERYDGAMEGSFLSNGLGGFLSNGPDGPGRPAESPMSKGAASHLLYAPPTR